MSRIEERVREFMDWPGVSYPATREMVKVLMELAYLQGGNDAVEEQLRKLSREKLVGEKEVKEDGTD